MTASRFQRDRLTTYSKPAPIKTTRNDTRMLDASAIVGSHATRAQGSIGGNVMNASPAMDTGAPLLCHDAVAVLAGAAAVGASASGSAYSLSAAGAYAENRIINGLSALVLDDTADQSEVAAATITGTIASPSSPSVRLTALPAATMTNPPNAKDKQGDLYVEEVPAGDSTAVKTDSLKVVPADTLKK